MQRQALLAVVAFGVAAGGIALLYRDAAERRAEEARRLTAQLQLVRVRLVLPAGESPLARLARDDRVWDGLQVTLTRGDKTLLLPEGLTLVRGGSKALHLGDLHPLDRDGVRSYQRSTRWHGLELEAGRAYRLHTDNARWQGALRRCEATLPATREFTSPAPGQYRWKPAGKSGAKLALRLVALPLKKLAPLLAGHRLPGAAVTTKVADDGEHQLSAATLKRLRGEQAGELALVAVFEQADTRRWEDPEAAFEVVVRQVVIGSLPAGD